MKKSEIMKQILYALGIAGVIKVSLAVPSLPIALMSVYKPLKKYRQGQIRRSFAYLKAERMVGVGQEGNKTIIKLLESGKERFVKFKLDDIQIKPVKWDSKWRIVMFDIPEQYKYARQNFSRKLKEIGFKTLQKSAWICPYKCSDEIDFIVGVYAIDPFVRLITVDSSQIEKNWQKNFN